MKNIIKIIILMVFLMPAHAAHAQSVVIINEADCDRLVAHVAAPGVAYTPGVDVNGRAVAPADLNGAPDIRVPDVITIPVTIDLATRLGIPVSFLARPTVGEVQVSRDGRASFNGEPLTSEAEHELAKRCQGLRQP
jgi:hypothetical protein